MLAQIATTVLGFFLLVVVLRKFFWPTILLALDERRQHIEDGFKNLARSRQELERIQAEYAQRLAQIEGEARSKIQQAILEGKRIAVEIQEQARAQGSAIINKSKETVELELAKAKVMLRDQVAEMTIEAVERMLRQKLDAKTDRRLVDTVLDELEREGSRP
jgi:F-type H+-transporting ATPase subunit b